MKEHFLGKIYKQVFILFVDVLLDTTETNVSTKQMTKFLCQTVSMSAKVMGLSLLYGDNVKLFTWHPLCTNICYIKISYFESQINQK